LNARGYAHFRLKQYAKALADFDQAIRLNRSYLNAYINRSATRRAAGDKPGRTPIKPSAGADAKPEVNGEAISRGCAT